ncbi:hypothetical protein EDD16DRAFT_854024 [Pisolithus croceorrhizus]|nr:hypothetical protein EDD16DRAFT_854024 [Pisolithus croceorrhizus]KAI6156389.1 hypothetical protein EDD17DRAFT_1047338 [Pisolithus thermaeus]
MVEGHSQSAADRQKRIRGNGTPQHPLLLDEAIKTAQTKQRGRTNNDTGCLVQDTTGLGLVCLDGRSLVWLSTWDSLYTWQNMSQAVGSAIDKGLGLCRLELYTVFTVAWCKQGYRRRQRHFPSWGISWRDCSSSTGLMSGGIRVHRTSTSSRFISASSSADYQRYQRSVLHLPLDDGLTSRGDMSLEIVILCLFPLPLHNDSCQ